MTEIFRDTGLGRLFGLDFTRTKPDIESTPSWLLRSQNHALALKLEAARIPATYGQARRDAVRLAEGGSSKESLSTASTRSDDTKTKSKIGPVADQELGWDGADDPENPLNFPVSKKVLIEALINLVTMCNYLGTSIFSPGIASMTKEFHTSQTVATLGTSLSLLGYAIGPMVWSPISETPSIGRNPVYISTLAVFILIQVPTALATNIETVLIFRFLSGVFGSPPQATGGATLSDIYLPKRRSYAIGLWELSAWAAPTLGPLVGGLAVQIGGWRWTIWELMIINCVMFILIFCFLPETSASNILYRRAKRLRAADGNLPPTTTNTEKKPRQTILAFVHETLVRPFRLCFGEPICLLLNSYTALCTGLFFAWFETLSVVLVNVYKFDLVHLGFAFLGLLVGAATSYVCFLTWFRCSESKNFDRDGTRRPEERFVPLMCGCVFMPLSLFLFGWTAREDVPAIVPIVGSGFFSLGSFSLFISILNYLPDAYPEYAASVLAGNNFLRCTSGAGCVLFATPLYTSLGPAWASTILGLVGVAFVPVPFLFYFLGGRIRKASKFALKDR